MIRVGCLVKLRNLEGMLGRQRGADKIRLRVLEIFDPQAGRGDFRAMVVVTMPGYYPVGYTDNWSFGGWEFDELTDSPFRVKR